MQGILALDPDRIVGEEFPRIAQGLLPGHLVIARRGPEVIDVGPPRQVVLVRGACRDQNLNRDRREQEESDPEHFTNTRNRE